ncbi:MAG TPA: 7-cyano-7-deazaguanine synthase QueC [Fermentimonas sp.]|nr:7-cyano-7-deazaguanine synthase QueC [Fermentimonas sp.]
MNDYKHQDAIVLFSGGQDSTTCLFWAKREFRNVHALCFSYGQRHIQEIENAKRLAEMANVEFSTLDTSVISKLAPNSLTNKELIMDREVPNNSYPNTFVPGRNLLFLTFAATIAYAKDIRHIVTGVSEADYSGYPDCRDTFIKSANATLNLAMDKQFLIHTPLMWRTKKDVWQLADELDVFDLVKNETLTCYNGIIAEGCGDCPACIIRNKGLEEYISVR